MRLLSNQELVKDKWIKLIDQSKYSSPFQTPEFYDLFNSTYNCAADVFAIENRNEYDSLIVVTIQKQEGLKKYFSRRGIIYGGPLLKENSHQNLTKLLEEITIFYEKKIIYLEFRNYFDYSGYNSVFSNCDFEYVPWLNFKLNCNNLDEIKKRMSNSRLRQIKKALKSGVLVEEAKSKEDVISFYKILSKLYKTKVKKPLLNVNFFLNFYNQNFGKYLLVYYNGEVIGGIMCPIFGNVAIYEFYVCGLHEKYKNQYPSIMATWGAMEYAVENNIRIFDFMGAGSPDQEYGVRDFKSHFGGTLVENGRYIKIINPFLYKVGLIGLKLVSKFKL